MKEESLESLTIEQLKVREKMLKTSVYLITTSVIILALAGAFLYYKQGFSTFTVLPIIFFSIVMITNTNLRKVRAEIALRENK